VIDSTPETEWRELLLKARAFLLALDGNVAATVEEMP
jgi:anthranilate/para-aminobenzoate synthase component I